MSSTQTFEVAEWQSFFADASDKLRDPRTSWLRLDERARLEGLFSSFWLRLSSHRDALAVKRRHYAPEFTVFDFIKPKENVLSNILRVLIDPESKHGQGAVFLEQLVQRALPTLNSKLTLASVVREAPTYTISNSLRRLDLLITSPEAVLGIEAKTFTGEGRQQISDYCQHLAHLSGSRPFCLIFLSRTGAAAASICREAAERHLKLQQLISWSWERDVRDWLEACRKVCEAPKVCHFLEDFNTYIAHFLAITKEDHQA